MADAVKDVQEAKDVLLPPGEVPLFRAGVLIAAGEFGKMVAWQGDQISAVNIRRATELQKLGRMAPAGLRAFEARDEKKSAIYSYENRPRELAHALE